MTRFRSFALVIALVAPVAAAASSPASSGLDQPAIAAAAGRCAGDVTCTRALIDDLARAVEGTMEGARGPASWLRLVAAARGSRIAPVTIARAPLGQRIMDMYEQVGYAITPQLRERVAATVGTIPAGEARAVSDLLGAMLTADRLSREAIEGSGIERVFADTRRAVELTTLIGSSPPGTHAVALEREFHANMAAIARVDHERIATAAAVLTDAVARFPVHAVSEPIDLPLILVGAEGDTVHTEDRLLLVDRSGNDIYKNNAGGMLLGVAGGSIALDYGDGNDWYEAGRGAQGYGQGAAGLLYDEGGSDTHLLNTFGMGASVAGAGILYDAGNARDRYIGTHVGAQAPIGALAAALGGLGIVVDEGGPDEFEHDGLDGFSWGAATGTVLIASLGTDDDTYRSDEIPVNLLGTDLGTFTGPIQVSSEVNGVSLLYDEGGNDSYVCGAHVRQGCQGSAGPGSFALLWDIAGNDTYWMGESISPLLPGQGPLPIKQPYFPMGQGGAYSVGLPAAGHAQGILYDESGADVYTAQKWAQGYAMGAGIGLLYDIGESPDTYATVAPFVGVRADGQTWMDGAGGVGIDE